MHRRSARNRGARARANGTLGRGVVFFFSSRRRHTRCSRDWSSDVCSSDLEQFLLNFIFWFGPDTNAFPKFLSPYRLRREGRMASTVFVSGSALINGLAASAFLLPFTGALGPSVSAAPQRQHLGHEQFRWRWAPVLLQRASPAQERGRRYSRRPRKQTQCP